MQSILARISLPAVRQNAETVKTIAARPVIAVVKDDAYGHGAEETALAIEPSVFAFAVATVAEGAALRCAGVQKDVLVLTPPLCREESERLLRYGLTASLSSAPDLRLLSEAGERTGIAPRAHLAVNTGMNRYGVRPALAGAFSEQARSYGVSVEGVFTHFYLPEDGRRREEQEELFQRAADGVKARFPSAVTHMSATGGVLFSKKDLCDCARVGLMLYGYAPVAVRGLRRAMKLYAAVSHRCKQFGGGAGYAAAERQYGDLYTLRLGYGDGFFRESFTGAVGKLCMDAAVMEGDLPFGKRKLVVDDFAAYARAHNTSVYEALVRLTQKAEREYIR